MDGDGFLVVQEKVVGGGGVKVEVHVEVKGGHLRDGEQARLVDDRVAHPCLHTFHLEQRALAAWQSGYKVKGNGDEGNGGG